MRRWLMVEKRAAGPGDTLSVISRHWTRAGALVAASLGEENWRNMRGEVKAGRACWDPQAGWVERYPGGIRSDIRERAAALSHLPWISYHVRRAGRRG